MNEIHALNSGFLQPGDISGKKKTPKGKISNSKFRKLLNTNLDSRINSVALDSSSDEVSDVEALVDNIYEAGEQLITSMTYTAVKDYREKLKQFLSFVVKNNLVLEHQQGVKLRVGEYDWKNNEYKVIKTIDEKLEKLTAAILQNQKTQMEIASRINELNGLIVDLLG